MSEKSICVGCVHAKWEREPSGRLDRRGSGRCVALEAHPIKLPAAFCWGTAPRYRILGGSINRREPFPDAPKSCDFREETAP